MTSIARVGTDIWVGGNGGIYTSSNEGLSWQKSTLTNDLVQSILSYNDTVIVCYIVIDGTDYTTYSISSFNAGQSWTNPYVLEQPNFIDGGKLIKTAKAIYYPRSFDYMVSMNGGQTWNVSTTPLGNIGSVISDGVMSIGTAYMSGYPYNAYYYSLDGSTPWMLLDSSMYISDIISNNNRIFVHTSGMAADSILKTDDFGATWDTIYTGATGTFLSIFHLNNALYIIASQDTLISTDNGLTWNTGLIPEPHFFKPGLNTVTGNWLFLEWSGDVTTYFPTNGTYLITNTGILAHPLACLYENNNVIFASGNDKLYRSPDGGISWIQADSVIATIDKMIFFGDSIYAVDQGYGIFARSYDNGVTWYSDTIPTYTNSSTPCGIAKLNGTIYINGSESLYSNDEGMTWDTGQ